MAEPKEKKRFTIPTQDAKKKRPTFDNLHEASPVDADVIGLASQLPTEPASQRATSPSSHLAETASQQPIEASHHATVVSQRASEPKLASHVASEPDSQRATEKEYSRRYLHEQTLQSRQGKTPLNTRVLDILYEQLLELGVMLGANIQEMAAEALDDLIHKYTGRRVASQQASMPTSVLKELTKLELLNLYSQKSGKKVSSRDRKLFDKGFAMYHPLLLELGIREAAASVAEKGSELYSFQYCLNACSYRADWQIEYIEKELMKFRAGNLPV